MIDSPVFWLFLLGTIGVSSWVLVRAFIRPERLVEFPCIASGMWLYFYGIMPLKLGMSFDHWDLSAAAMTLHQCLAFFSLLFLLWGWRWALRRAPNERRLMRGQPDYNAMRVGGLGLALLFAACVLEVIQRGSLTSIHQKLELTSGYLYLGFHLAYPGFALCLYALFNLPHMRRVGTILMGGLLLLDALPNILNARRGPMFPFFIILIVLPPLLTGRTPKRWKYAAGGAVVVTLMFLFLAARPFIYGTGTWEDALNKLSFNDIFVKHTEMLSDNEFANGTWMMQTAQATGKYQYGTSYLLLPLNVIPNQWWPNKPAISEGLFPAFTRRDMLDVTGGQALNGGGSGAGVAETFIQFSYLCPFFWAVIAYLVGRLYVYVIADRRVLPALVYTMFMATTHWLISQSLNAAFVPMTIYIFFVWAVMWVSKVTYQSYAAEPLNPSTI